MTISISSEKLKATVRKRGQSLGFDVIGFAKADIDEKYSEALERFVLQNRHATMDWLADTKARRRHPQALWPEARSIIACAVNYGPDENPLEALKFSSNAVIASYARGDDYHELVKGRLKNLASYVASLTGAEVKVFVDTAPVLEKPAAEQAGLGWIGKHTNLVSKQFGSWLLLGEIFVAASIEPDQAHRNFCGSCRACLDICPTGAFPKPFELDPRLCISYWTIEHKGSIDRHMRPLIGNRIFGCDDCLAVCPWNKFARKAKEARLTPRSGCNHYELAQLVSLSEEEFKGLFRKSPVNRTGRIRLLRNVLIAIGNSGKKEYLTVIRPFLRHESDLLRATVIWALARLNPGSIPEIKELLHNDPSPLVQEEMAFVCSQQR